MLLAIDAGNTNLTLGVFRGAELIFEARLNTDPDKSGDEYGVEIRELLQRSGVDSQSIDGIVIASVVPPLDHALAQMAAEYFRLTPFFVDHTSDTGLTILYDPPSAVGVDRIVDAVAAVRKYGGPCIVVDFGTATTFNVVNAQHEYLGGAIAPGLKISAEALFSRAAKLPTVEIKRPDKAIGSSTIEAMQSGLYHGYAGLVDGVLEQILAELDGNPHVIATGGLAPLIATASKYIDEVDSTLMLEGLRLMYEAKNH